MVNEASLRFVTGRAVGLMERAVMGGEQVGKMCGVSGGWWGGGGGMWSRHTFSLARLEPTRTGVGSPGAKMESVVGVRRQEITRGLKEGGDGEERVREGSIRGRPERNREKESMEVKVSVGSSGEDRSIGKGEGHGWKLGRAHEVCKRGEDRLTKEDMGSAGVGEDWGRVTEHNRGVW
jgi:hypothetical protein